MRRAAAIMAVSAALVACSVPAPKPALVKTVAVLPFENMSNDLNAPDRLQQLVYLALKPSVYEVRSIDETNARLGEFGIKDGGQLPVLDPVKIAQDLGVQGLLYGSVENFGYTNLLGYYQSRKVTLSLRFVDGTTGSTLWEKTATGSTTEVNIDQKKAEEAFARGLAQQLADKALKLPLEPEARQAVVKALSTLPGFSFTGFAEDGSAGRRTAQDILNNVLKKKK